MKSRYDEIDYDYITELSEEEKTWLNDFTSGYINADFRSEGTRKIFREGENTKIYTKHDDLMDYYDKLTDEQKNLPEIIARKQAIENQKLTEQKPKKKKKIKDVKKESYNKNNSRNRCIYTRARASSNLISTEDYQRELKQLEKEQLEEQEENEDSYYSESSYIKSSEP